MPDRDPTTSLMWTEAKIQDLYNKRSLSLVIFMLTSLRNISNKAGQGSPLPYKDVSPVISC